MLQHDGTSAASARDRLRDIQHEILEATASGQSLGAVMEHLCRRVEELVPDTICSVLSVDERGLLHPLAGPSLPVHYSAALDGIAIGPGVGSCGTAAYRGEPVAVIDIETDPLWADFKALARPLGLRACWSSPIKARDHRVVGTFAFYYRVPRGPSPLDEVIVGACTHLCAIALEQEEARIKIHRLAFYDPVTDLPNRALFQKSAAETLAEPGRDGSMVAIHYLDLDDFKAVNDTLGHPIGDELLRQVAERLTASVAAGDMVARLGGDEFAVLQRTADGRDAVHAFAESLIAAVDRPFDLQGHAVAVRMSIGFATAAADGDDLTALMRYADLALYRAKSDGGGRYRMFDPDMFRHAIARRRIEQDLRGADFDREFELVYQPITSLRSGEPVGGEALIRWHHPERGPVSPAEFIPIAEQSGLMGEIGDWVMKTACADAARWPSSVTLAINLSPAQLKRPGFALGVMRTLQQSGLPAQRLEFEITETALLADAAAARTILRQFKDAGIRIALDDFGTGYSSLSHLRAFPIDTIKIDRSFVREFGAAPDSTAIITAVLRLARELGMTTTAEGIETEEQLARIRAAGCCRAQGYLLGKPQPAAEFAAMLGGTTALRKARRA